MSTVEQLEKDVQDIKVVAGVHSQRLDTIEHDMEQMRVENKVIYDIGSSVKILAEGMTAMKEDVADVKEDLKQGLEDVHNGQSDLGSKLDAEVCSMKKDIDELRTQPLKRRSDWMDKVVWAIAGGVLAFVVNLICQQLLG